MSAKRIVIFASGGGSNAQAIIDHFEDTEVEIAHIFANNPKAGVLDRAKKHGIAHNTFDRTMFRDGTVLAQLKKLSPDLIVLAGFLWLIPKEMVEAFPRKVINIHPALLPKYGGAGMYGMNVHRAVKEAGETKSGPTIHYVNEKYDDGAIIFQVTCKIDPDDSAEDIAAKVLQLEHNHYPKVIAELLENA